MYVVVALKAKGESRVVFVVVFHFVLFVNQAQAMKRRKPSEKESW